jgi:hypothetical protein
LCLLVEVQRRLVQGFCAHGLLVFGLSRGLKGVVDVGELPGQDVDVEEESTCWHEVEHLK